MTQVESSTSDFELRPLEWNMPVAERLLQELRRMTVNGGAFFARFELIGDLHFHQLVYMSLGERWNEIDFFRNFLTHPTLRALLPDLTQKSKFDEPIRFEYILPLTLDGVLASDLMFSGAYENFRGTPREAKNLAAEFCDELFGDRFNDVEVFRSSDAWSSWFYQVAWDVTYIIIDTRLRLVTLICWTDTD